MNIWVCFKIQPDFEQVLESDWNGFTPDTDLSYAEHIFNCFDESSLEIALRLKEALAVEGIAANCGAVTLAPALRRETCKNLFAAGFDGVARINSRLEFSPGETGKRLARFLAGRRPDVVLAGKQAGYADTGTVPYYAAAGLGFPILNGLENLEWEGGKLVASQVSGTERRALAVKTPFVGVVGNSPVTALRASTLRKRMEAGNRQAEAIETEGEGGEALPAPSLTRRPPARGVRMLGVSEPSGASAALMEIIRKELRE